MRTGSALLLLPVSLVFLAWRLSVHPSGISASRARLFKAGLLTAVLCEVCVALAWFSPFSLRADGQGGFSNSWNGLCLYAAIAGSLLTLVLAFSGVGAARAILFLASILLALLTFAAMLSNFV